MVFPQDLPFNMQLLFIVVICCLMTLRLAVIASAASVNCSSVMPPANASYWYDKYDCTIVIYVMNFAHLFFLIGKLLRCAAIAPIWKDVAIACLPFSVLRELKMDLWKASPVRIGLIRIFHVLVSKAYGYGECLLLLTVELLVVIPRCENYEECLGCAGDKECAWCASENKCITISDAFAMDCRGLVFDPPCPSSYIAGTAQVLCSNFSSSILTFCLLYR